MKIKEKVLKLDKEREETHDLLKSFRKKYKLGKRRNDVFRTFDMFELFFDKKISKNETERFLKLLLKDKSLAGIRIGLIEGSKQTLAEVGEVIKLNAQRCYKEINLTTIPKNEAIFLCWCNRIDELMLMYAELKGCSVVQANKECGIDYYKLEELKQKIKEK